MPAASQPPHLPLATYRLQFNREFTFEQALQALDYLQELGISDLYASPVFQAAPESTHGYDICGYGNLNPNLGSQEQFAALSSALKQRGMGVLLDMVPNHMGSDLSNEWWLHVLENGPASPYAKWFDIDWRPPNPSLQGKVLLPILEDRYPTVLEAGKLRLEINDGRFCVAYYSNRFPLSARSYAKLMDELLRTSTQDQERLEIQRLRVLLEEPDLPPVQKELASAFQRFASLKALAEQTLEGWNGSPGNPGSFNQLHRLLQKQHYRLAYWRVGSQELNYRRFFDVTQLVSVRVEDAEVFEGTHRFLFELIGQGVVSALRIDHPDGLWDPREYCQRIQSRVGPIYLIVEKILTGKERLPLDWPVHGTTGYDFLNLMNGVFVQTDNASAFDALYYAFTGMETGFEPLAMAGKRQVLERSLPGELSVLANRLHQVAGARRDGADFTATELHRALAEVISAFPVYRTYLALDSTAPTEQDATVIRHACRAAASHNPHLDPAVFGFLERILSLQTDDGEPEARSSLFLEFVGKFQQLTGPTMAKGLEDTTFYNYNRLLSLNEVGGSPDQFGTTVNAFHLGNLRRAEAWPHSLLASATHDTKRGEDVRARLNVLSEMPETWRMALFDWQQRNSRFKTRIDGREAPDRNDEYLFYQSLVGTWEGTGTEEQRLEMYRRRLADYMAKAIKESKRHTSWMDPDAAYEKATRNFVERVLHPENQSFLKELMRFVKPIVLYGSVNSLAQVLLKSVSPGVPDFYQGTEFSDLTLVDPDNRRPVDYSQRYALLKGFIQEVKEPDGLGNIARRTATDLSSGHAKLFATWRALQTRRSYLRLVQHGSYLPLQATGARASNVCAFARSVSGEERILIVVVPRLLCSALGAKLQSPVGDAAWLETRLESPGAIERQFRNELTGKKLITRANQLRLADVFQDFPVALLVSC